MDQTIITLGIGAFICFAGVIIFAINDLFGYEASILFTVVLLFLIRYLLSKVL